MKFNFLNPLKYFGYLTAIMLMVNCTPMKEVKPMPSISITPSIPPINNENITGQIHGAEAHLYAVYIYALTQDGWFNILNKGSASILIAEDKSWDCELNNIKRNECIPDTIYKLSCRNFA